MIETNLQKNLNETLVGNLCVMYDMQSETSLMKKKHLMNLIQSRGCDSFDFSILKIPTTSQ
jgi:hypothetical protein